MPMICILGRQPAISLAELESCFGSASLSTVLSDVAKLEVLVQPVFFEQLGGSQKAGEIISVSKTSDWNKLSLELKKTVMDILKEAPERKITLGISTYGLTTNVHQINSTALSLKKTIKQSGRPARIVPNKETSLNTAQVLHNKLAMRDGIELLIVRDGAHTIIARTTWVQNIEAYRQRDQERPMRDARIGMLPPKLAQIIINLACPPENSTSPYKLGTGASLNFNETKVSGILLDPFCGTGVILQEALLRNLNVKGTDLESRMVEYSRKNLEWLRQNKESIGLYELSAADATECVWKKPFNTIASETYLGRPLSTLPDPQTLRGIIQDCDTILKKFLQNIARQTASGFRMCIAVPAWYHNNGYKQLPLLDHLEELGYNRISFTHTNTSDMIYRREGQIVARELVVLSRK